MSARFLVTGTVHLPSARVFAIEGSVLEGVLKGGDVVQVADDPSKTIKIKSIALVGERKPSGTITLSVEPPSFPLESLDGVELVMADTPAVR